LLRGTMIDLHPVIVAPFISLAMLAGCSEAPKQDAAEDQAADPQDEFWTALSSHCGKAYEGGLVSTDEADEDFAGVAMQMQVRECSESRIAIPFHVQLDGEWDRSRTWLITRNDAGGLRLKHDHRHEDGEPDAVTMCGGDTADDGSASAQNFPVDQVSIAMFEREGLTASVTNIWTVEIDPASTSDAAFAYQLRRTVEGGAPEERHFRVEFDLTNEVEAPPAAWGQD